MEQRNNTCVYNSVGKFFIMWLAINSTIKSVTQTSNRQRKQQLLEVEHSSHGRSAIHLIKPVCMTRWQIYYMTTMQCLTTCKDFWNVTQLLYFCSSQYVRLGDRSTTWQQCNVWRLAKTSGKSLNYSTSVQASTYDSVTDLLHDNNATSDDL